MPGMTDTADEDLVAAIAEFVGAFETVFRYDWQHTLDMIGDESEGATFIEPGLNDEFNDLASRGFLLEKYRQLVGVLKQRGIEPEFPIPLDRIPGSPKRVW